MNKVILSAIIDIVFFLVSIILVCTGIMMVKTNNAGTGICIGIALFLMIWVSTGATDLIIKKNNNAKQ